MKKQLFNLPDKPVDKYRIEYYRVNDGNVICVDHVIGVYYVNTPYAELNPNVKSGAPIQDDWMMYCNGTCTGRFSGWSFMGKNSEWFHNCYLTRQEAIDREIAILKTYIDYHTRTAKEYERQLNEEVRTND